MTYVVMELMTVKYHSKLQPIMLGGLKREDEVIPQPKRPRKRGGIFEIFLKNYI